MFFGNRSIRIHLLRGLGGFVALYLALETLDLSIWPALVLLPCVVYLLKGCPICWTMGLIETIVMTVHRRNEGKFDTDTGDSIQHPRAGTLVRDRSTG